MRVPLKFQLVAPLAAATFALTAALAAYQAQQAARRVDERIARQAAGVADALAGTSFPLSETVLRQMRDLSGAEFVVDRSGALGAATLKLSPASFKRLGRLKSPDLRTAASARDWSGVELDGTSYFHARLPANPQRPFDKIHLLYPRDDYRSAIAAAVWPPIALGLAAVGATALTGWWLASRMGRAVADVGAKLQRIAAGEFVATHDGATKRNDELGDLARAANDTAEQLAEYSTKLRRSEQLRTLGQLSAGIAHEIRNAATGARLAVQHSQAEQAMPAAADDPLSVANRQLQLIEQYVQRFLLLGKSEAAAPRDEIDLAALLAESVSLAQPYAKHLGAALATAADSIPQAVVTGDPIGLRQAIDNLVMNALDAAVAGSPPAEVLVRLQRDGSATTLTVVDSGAGPTPAIAQRMFEPLVTDKTDGAGLGLALARQAAVAHNGTLSWRRRDDRTEFTLALPIDAATSPRDAQQ